MMRAALPRTALNAGPALEADAETLADSAFPQIASVIVPPRATTKASLGGAVQGR